MTTRIAITSSLFLGLAILLVPSAQAMSPPPLHQPDGMTTQVRYYGLRAQALRLRRLQALRL
jgi:hypothetical protein